MKTNRILSAITAMAVSACALGTYAAAWTKPEYSFDVDQYLCKSCVTCDEFSAPDVPDIEFAPNCVLIGIKGEHSYPNSIWTIDDFPELAEAGLTVESVVDLTAFSGKDDEWLEDYLSKVSFHQILAVNLGEYNYKKVRAVKEAIVEATLAGKHPEIANIGFNILTYDETSALKGDVDGSGLINVVDATLVARYSVGGDVTSGFSLRVADVNGDLKVNIIDATYIARYSVGAIDSF